MSTQSEINRINGLKETLSDYLVSIGEATGDEPLADLIDKAIILMGIDTAMSDTSTRAVQNRVIKAYVDANSGGGGAFASMFDIALADTYTVATEADAPLVIENALNLDGFVSAIGNSGISWKKPTVTVPPIEWATTVDEDYNYTGITTVMVNFGNAGALSKVITFKKMGEGKVFGARLSDTTSHVDTGISGQYEYRYHVKGRTGAGAQAVLADAFVDATQRATARLLGASNKIQSMWPANREVTQSMSGADVTSTFEMTVGGNYLTLQQGNINYTASISGHTTSGSVGETITLLGSKSSGQYGNGTLCFAEILNGSETIAYFEPYKIANDEIVFIDRAGLTGTQIFDIVQNGDSSIYANRIHRPTSGTLIEVEV